MAAAMVVCSEATLAVATVVALRAARLAVPTARRQTQHRQELQRQLQWSYPRSWYFR